MSRDSICTQLGIGSLFDRIFKYEEMRESLEELSTELDSLKFQPYQGPRVNTDWIGGTTGKYLTTPLGSRSARAYAREIAHHGYAVLTDLSPGVHDNLLAGY